MEKLKDLKDLLIHEVQDLYSAEEQILEAMPLMIETAKNPALTKALQQHLKVTEEQKKRLDRVKEILGEGSSENGDNGGGKSFLSGLFGGGDSSHKCKGTQGIIEEGNKILAMDMNEEVMDAAIIASAQKIEL